MRAQVEALAGFGMTQEEVSRIIGISESSINAHLKEEWSRGLVKADAAVLTNLFKIATGNTPSAAAAAIFWTKVRRRWHEVQRIIHGFDPEIVNNFVRQVVAMLRRELPDKCPHCKTSLGLPQKVANLLRDMSKKFDDQRPPSQIVPKPIKEPGE